MLLEKSMKTLFFTDHTITHTQKDPRELDQKWLELSKMNGRKFKQVSKIPAAVRKYNEENSPSQQKQKSKTPANTS